MFFGLFGSEKKKRRTSGGKKRRTSRKQFSGGSVRKGSISYKGVTAQAARGRFAGRVRLKRSALVEYPTADQLIPILRHYGVPKEATVRAFGHMMKEPRNKPKRKTTRRSTGRRKTSRKRSRRKTSRRRSTKRRSTKRRTSRKRSPKRRAKRHRLRRNTAKKRSVRRDYISVPTSLDGDPISFSAAIADVPDQLVDVLGARQAVGITIAGEKAMMLAAAEAMRASNPWVTKKEFRKAFGHLLKGSRLGETPPQKGIPTVYGPRSMKLGHLPHWKPGDPLPRPTKGEVITGIAPGQLILFHKPSGAIVWQAYDHEDTDLQKPIYIKFGGGSVHVDFTKAVQGARVGAGKTRGREAVGAMDRNIPIMALLQAFDYLLTPASRKRIYAEFVLKK